MLEVKLGVIRRDGKVVVVEKYLDEGLSDWRFVKYFMSSSVVLWGSVFDDVHNHLYEWNKGSELRKLA